MKKIIFDYLILLYRLLEAYVFWKCFEFLTSKTLVLIGYPAGDASSLLSLISVAIVYSLAAILDDYLKDTEIMKNAQILVRNNQSAILNFVKLVFVGLIKAKSGFLLGAIASFIFYLILKYKRRK